MSSGKDVRSFSGKTWTSSSGSSFGDCTSGSAKDDELAVEDTEIRSPPTRSFLSANGDGTVNSWGLLPFRSLGLATGEDVGEFFLRVCTLGGADP